MAEKTALQQGLEVVKKATQHDHMGRNKEAAFLYFLSIELFTEAVAVENDENKKLVINKKINEYRNRALHLLAILQTPSSSSSPSPYQSNAVNSPIQSSPSPSPSPSPSSLSPSPSPSPSSLSPSPSPSSLSPSSSPHLVDRTKSGGNNNKVKDKDLNVEDKMEEALNYLESANQSQNIENGECLGEALKDLEKGAEILTELLSEEYKLHPSSSPDQDDSIYSKRKIEEKLSLTLNRISHLKLHLSAKSKFQPAAYNHYLKADSVLNKAREKDEGGALPDAIRLYEAANVHFRQSLHAETNAYLRGVIGKRMLLCNQRIEQITYYQKGNQKLLPVKMGLRAGDQTNEPPEAKEQKGIWSLLTSAVSTVFQSENNNNNGGRGEREGESLVGTMLNERPDCDGEWIYKVKFLDTKTMTDPSNSSSYTVYIIEVYSKTMENGKHISSDDWKVIRRYKQISALKAKLESMKITVECEFPPSKVFGDVLNPAVVEERRRGFQQYFNLLLSLPSSSALNKILMQFLRNSFNR